MNEQKGWSIMKKYLSILLALTLLLTIAPLSVFAESGPDGEEPPVLKEPVEEVPEEEEAPEELAYPDELIVGNTTVLKGDFFTEMFGNGTSDIDVRALIHGYNLINWDQAQGVYVIDPSVVEKVEVVEDIEGNRTYYFALWDDLYYSDGTPITAWDYAFSLLLMMSPEIEQIGGKIYRAEHILGYNEYITKEYPMLTGVQVLTDHQLAITLDHEFLPYFFELGLMLCVPYPIREIAPGCKVYDDGMGVYIGNEDQSIKEALYTAELLKKTILDPETGYNSHPSVVSGPYTLVSYDGTTAHFEINPYFKGAWIHTPIPTGNAAAYIPLLDVGGNPVLDTAGSPVVLVKPTIEKICYTLADNDTVIQQIKDGEMHLFNKAMYGPTVLEGMQSGAVMRFSNYPRLGMSFLTFTYDWPTVHEKAVRQAIAWCMDRDALTQEYCQGFGFRMDGYFGIEKWEYKLIKGEMEYPTKMKPDLPDFDQAVYDAEIAAWKSLNLNNLKQYTVDLETANRLLDEAHWTLNRDGEAYRPGVDDVRCKKVGGKLVALDLSMMYPEGNHIAEMLQEPFIDNLNQCGIKLTLVPAPMQDLLAAYYREAERTTDMIYLATNFHVVVDPSITYSNDKTANHLIWNNTFSDDEELYRLAVDMRKTKPGEVFEYVQKWVRFQERYNEVLPAIPIYSNIYFDFFNPALQNYNITSHVTWSQAILEAYFGQDPAPQPTEAEDTDTMIFD